MKSKMLKLAEEAMKNAYTPYVDFPVGVCLRTPENKYFVGCNVQNCALPQSFCAETSAIASMVSAGFYKIADILVMTSTGKTLPCGGCRQKILEFSNSETAVYVANPGVILDTFLFADLVPHPFSPQSLKNA